MATIGLVLACIAAFWVYNDARKIGHSNGVALLWSAGTLLMLIVFLPLYIILGRRTGARPRQDETAIDIEGVPVEELASCNMCGGKVKEDFKVCPYCGFTLKPKCQNCGQELKREWQKCPTCGTDIDGK